MNKDYSDELLHSIELISMLRKKLPQASTTEIAQMVRMMRTSYNVGYQSAVRTCNIAARNKRTKA